MMDTTWSWLLQATIYLGGLLLTFMVWTMLMYGMHRLAHLHSKRNPLWILHTAHHRIPYLSRRPTHNWPKLGQYFFWLGDWKTSLDVLLTMTFPLLLLTALVPQYALPLLVGHYFYELFLSEHRLDHNPYVVGFWTRIFAWGDYHLHHHAHPRRNFGLLVTWWDRLFGTAEDPPEGAALRRLQHMAQKQAQLRALERSQYGNVAKLQS